MSRDRVTRTANEFNIGRLSSLIRAPRTYSSTTAWDINAILSARNYQLSGQFSMPVKMAKYMRTDDAMYVAWKNRLAPQQSLSIDMSGPDKDILNEALPLFGRSFENSKTKNGVGIKHGAMNNIMSDVANHCIGVGFNHWTPRMDGSRWDIQMRYWPLEHVRVNSNNQLVTRAEWVPTDELKAHPEIKSTMDEIPIVHGDGRWVVFTKYEHEPWTQDAAILPAALIWGSHAYAMSDWGKASKSHGDAKVIGELPQGTPLLDEDGNVSADAAAMLELLAALYDGESPFGLIPSGGKVQWLGNGSSAWQVWSELTADRKRSAARIYCGTDGFLGAQGGAPGIDITKLFGVAVTIVEGDLRECIEPCFQTGVIDPWCAVNFGNSSLAPTRKYLIPDADADAVRASYATRRAAFNADLKASKENGIIVDQDMVDELAKKYDVQGFKIMAQVPANIPAASVPTNIPVASGDELALSSDDPDGDGLPGVDLNDEDVLSLANQMTEHGIIMCEHGSRNRCRICGIERKRSLKFGDDGKPVLDKNGAPIWMIAWRPIKV